MKYTNLDLVQSILSSMNSSEVNSVSDNAESRQVLEVIRTTYFNIISRANLPEHTKLFSLTASSDHTKPTLMRVPNTVNKIHWIKYNKGIYTDLQPNVDYPDWEYISILSIPELLDMVSNFDANENNIGTFTHDGFTFYYRNDNHPTYCCLLQDQYLIFDSYLATVDTTLQSSKALGYAKHIPTFELTDTFVPDLDEQQFALLLNEAKSLAFMELKQTEHAKAEQESRRQWRSMQKSKATIDEPTDFEKLPNYSRSGRGYGYPKIKLH